MRLIGPPGLFIIRLRLLSVSWWVGAGAAAGAAGATGGGRFIIVMVGLLLFLWCARGRMEGAQRATTDQDHDNKFWREIIGAYKLIPP